ncbi:hypothetical protein PVK06_023268 [Gossypium arboreum]|uniref:DUF4283 domain-containing protein n=1 Tax=Gossypium arboreum TaxID=29729 RepID=A0ABR0PAT3_GOSAR|nr:hypothetical protein PVK06_023268 [Gossypium arboreum]
MLIRCIYIGGEELGCQKTEVWIRDSVMHFPSLRNTMADLWHPIGGISITDLDTRFASRSNVRSNAQQFGSFLGSFLVYDMKILASVVKRENFCPIRVRVDPTKIIFGWDISLHAPMRRGSSMGPQNSNRLRLMKEYLNGRVTREGQDRLTSSAMQGNQTQ